MTRDYLEGWPEMRLFFALPVEIETKLAIESWRNRVFPRDIRPVPAENFHITLNFLGDVKVPELDRLCAGAAELIPRLTNETLKLKIDKCGYWPSPGILWIGPSSWPAQTDELHAGLSGLANSIGIAQSKHRYQPHITLFRSKQALPKPLIEPNFELLADEVVLYQSVQKKHGVQYQAIESWPIQEAIITERQGYRRDTKNRS